MYKITLALDGTRQFTTEPEGDVSVVRRNIRMLRMAMPRAVIYVVTQQSKIQSTPATEFLKQHPEDDHE